jgi:hypothetical protein
MGFEPTRFLEPADVHVYYPPDSTHPRVEIAGDRCVLSARIKLLFPLSDPRRFYAVQDADDKEVGVLRSLDGMDKESKQAVSTELDRRYFTPLITQIRTLRQDGGMWLFSVRTQRGPVDFYVRNWRDNSQELQPGRWQIQTVDGQRFQILNVDDLDARSQRLLEQLL